MPATVDQKTVGVTAVQLTAATGQDVGSGIKLSVLTDGDCFYGFSSDVTIENGFYINGTDTIHPKECDSDPSKVWFISDTAAQTICVSILASSPITGI